MLENPATPAPKGLYKMTVDAINSCLDAEEIEISFAKGYPINVKSLKDNKIYDTPLAIIEYLNKIGGAHGIGRIDIVENRYIGLKVHLRIIEYIKTNIISFKCFSLGEFTNHRAPKSCILRIKT